MSVSASQRQTMAVSRLIRASKAPRSARAISTTPQLLAKSDPSTPNPSPANPTTQTPPPPVTRASRFPFVGKPKVVLPSTPYTVSQPPQFPAPNDPFFQSSTTVTDGKGESAPPVPVTTRSGVPAQAAGYSDTTKAVVRGLARVMGYNSKASTAIRESGRMMRGIVEGIEKDRVYWYEECGLPPTYQTFFQLHLLYVLILLPRLRALTITAPTSTSSEIPETLEPLEPSHHPKPDLAQSTVSPSSSSGAPIIGKQDHELYPSELLNHFFELAESEMRKVLGRGERERVVKKYMSEMGEQWKGAGAGLDYVMGLEGEDGKADVELASWVWRNLYASQGLTAGPVPDAGAGALDKEVEMVQRLEEVVLFVRKEMKRLDQVEDIDVLEGNIGEWGSAKP